jgi:hypothetical protein
MIGGEWRVTEGKIQGFDEIDLVRRHSSAAKTLRKRAGLEG